VQNEEIGDVPDLFVRLDAPFSNRDGYVSALGEEFVAGYLESRDVIVESGLAADWVPPERLPSESDLAYFVRCCISFRRYYDGAMQLLVLALMPEQAGDAEGWQEWLIALLQEELPAEVRVMVLDDAGAPQLDRLAEEAPALVRTVRPELDMARAMEELAADSGETGPGSLFRRHLLRLNSAAAKGEVEAAARAAAAALRVAEREGWRDMQTVVHLALGAGYLGAGRAQDALRCYRAASAVSGEAQAQGDPAGPKLLIQSRFAEGSVLFNDGRLAEAAAVYETTAPVAAEHGEPILALEGWRMAAHCHEAEGRRDDAWRCGLPHVGQCLRRLAGRPPYDAEKAELEGRLARLLGGSADAEATPR
jgi:hypothetical protein